MDFTRLGKNNEIVWVKSDEVILNDAKSALDIAVTVMYEAESNLIILCKASVCEDFFKLSTCIAGEVLQKFVNYDVRLAIVGDFSSYTSKPLKDFIYESNRGDSFYFVATIEEAVSKLENGV